MLIYTLCALLIIPIDLNKEIFNLVTALQAQLDGLKNIIMKTLGKGKLIEGGSQEKLTDSSKKIGYKHAGPSKSDSKSKKTSKSKKSSDVTHVDSDSDSDQGIRSKRQSGERKRKSSRGKSREEKRKSVRERSRSRDSITQNQFGKTPSRKGRSESRKNRFNRKHKDNRPSSSSSTLLHVHAHLPHIFISKA